MPTSHRILRCSVMNSHIGGMMCRRWGYNCLPWRLECDHDNLLGPLVKLLRMFVSVSHLVDPLGLR